MLAYKMVKHLKEKKEEKKAASAMKQASYDADYSNKGQQTSYEGYNEHKSSSKDTNGNRY